MESTLMMEKMFPEKKKKNEISWPSSKVTRPIDDELRQAVIEGNVAVVKQLLNSGANVASRDTTFGRTPLGWAKCPKVATLLLSHSNNVKNDVHIRDYAGYSPLHIATINGNSEMIKLLKEHGGEEILLNTATVKEKPEVNISRKDIARHMEMFKSSKKEDPIPWVNSRVVSEIDSQLYQSVINSDTTSVKHLISAKGSIAFKDGTFGRTLLGWARDVDMVTVLLNATANVNARDFDGYTPLHCAVLSGNMDVALLLLNSGADPNITDISTFTALDWSIEVRNTKMSDLLAKVSPKPKNTGNNENQSKNTGKSEDHSKNTGKGENHSKNTGKSETHSKNTGKSETHSKNTGKGETHSKNTGKDDTHSKNTGKSETHSKNTEKDDTHSKTTGKNDTHSKTTGKNETHSKTTGKNDSHSYTQKNQISDNVLPPKANLPKLDKKPISISPLSQFPLTISETDAADILKGMPKTKDKIRFVAIDYNWGPPVSGRTDTDFLQLWAAVKNDVVPSSVTLYGQYKGDPNWNVIIPLVFVREVLEYQLYYLKVEGRLPVEFILKLECENGSVFYDNNGGYEVNYTLSPYMGRFASALVGTDHISVFSEFVHFNVVPKSEKKK